MATCLAIIANQRIVAHLIRDGQKKLTGEYHLKINRQQACILSLAPDAFLRHVSNERTDSQNPSVIGNVAIN
jgi:hypothetical protein